MVTITMHQQDDLTIRQPGFDLPRQQWSLLNRFRTEQGHTRLHSADEDAVSWLTNYGKWHAYEKKKQDDTEKPFRKTWTVEVCITYQHVDASLPQLFVKCFGNNLVLHGRWRHRCSWRGLIDWHSDVCLTTGTIRFPDHINSNKVNNLLTLTLTPTINTTLLTAWKL